MVLNIFGKRGSGKTTLIRGQLKFCRAPIIVVDILGNFNPQQCPTAIQVETNEAAVSAIKNYLFDKNEKNKLIVVKTAEPSLTVDYLSAALWEAAGGTLVLDETDSIRIAEAPCFDNLVRYGRNRNVDIITGVRRPAELDRDISAAANKMYIFGTHEPRDVEYFQKTVLGGRAEELIRLPRFSGIFIDYDKQLTGKFRIDIHGQIFHTEEVPFN